MANAMTLNPVPSFPSQRCYMVRLHADATPDALKGRLEHVNSGDDFKFNDAQELLELLKQHIARQASEPDPA